MSKVNQEAMKKFLLNVFEEGMGKLQDRNDILQKYSFYEGPAALDEYKSNPLYSGQSWKTSEGLDFIPSQDIRNHTKKLIQKQGRFMFGVCPDIKFKPLKKEHRDEAEAKRTFITTMLDDMEFWEETFKAFIDSTIGKRVLMTVIANQGEKPSIRYYRADSFSYKTDPMNYKMLKEVVIAVQDESTVGAKQEEQVWYKNKYSLENNIVYLETSTWDGNGKLISGVNVQNTTLDKIPCRVILNGGLTGNGIGVSDVAELIDLANAYNRTYSDFRDALRFKMFEQPVFKNVADECLDDLKIQPNAAINIKREPSLTEGQGDADAYMLSSTFSFQDAVKVFLEGTKADMYEIMDQPRPEDIKNVPSAKAIKFTFYDLIARCKAKWKAWKPAIKWAVEYLLYVTEYLGLYDGEVDREALDTEGSLIIDQRFPLPEDEETIKGIAIKEVEANVRSHKSYIRDHSEIEDEDGEYEEILSEMKDISEAESPAGSDIDTLDPEAEGDEEDDEKGSEEGDESNKKDPPKPEKGPKDKTKKGTDK